MSSLSSMTLQAHRYGLVGWEEQEVILEMVSLWIRLGMSMSLEIILLTHSLFFSCNRDENQLYLEEHTLGGQQSMTTVNEPGLYSLILSSRKPEAKRFKRWVTHEVLPAIRRTGRYAPQQALPLTPGIHVVANSPRHARWLWAQAVEAEVSRSLMRSVSERAPAPFHTHLLPEPSTD